MKEIKPIEYADDGTVLNGNLRDLALRMLEGKYWYCGRCNSIVPVTHWHRCGGDWTRTEPYPETR